MDLDQFVDRGVIQAADRHHTAQVDRLARAAADLKEAQAALTAATEASRAADRGVGPMSAFDAEAELETATRRHRVCERIHAAAVQALKDAEEGKLKAQGKAHRPLYLEAVRRRIAAAKAGDEARAALREADKAHREATELLEAARQQGTFAVEYIHAKPRQLVTEAEERKIWTTNQFDPDAGTFFHWYD